jgi:hypothetical protein
VRPANWTLHGNREAWREAAHRRLIDSSTWTPITTAKNLTLWGRSLVALPNGSPACGGGGGGGGTHLYVFGGFKSVADEAACRPAGLLHVLCPSGGGLSWVAVPSTGASPAPRAYHAAATSGSEIFISGGLTTGCDSLADLWRYSGETGTWSALTNGAPPHSLTTTPFPPPTYGHTLTYLDGLLLQLGGAAQQTFMQYAFDYSGDHGFPSMWRPLELRSNGSHLPGPRQGHVVCPFHAQTGSTSVVMHGGLGVPFGRHGAKKNDTADGATPHALDDFWRLSGSGTNTSWTMLGHAPAATYGHTCATLRSDALKAAAFVVSFGMLADGSSSHETSAWDPQTDIWAPQPPSAHSPSPRAWAAGAVDVGDPSSMYLLGGTANRSDDASRFGDLWQYELG